jgi:hypothetical protein
VELLNFMLRQVTVVNMRMMANAMCHNIAMPTPMQPIVVSFIGSLL